MNFKKEIPASLDEAIAKITQALQDEGFGILTRIDFHTKIKEKLNQDIRPVVILGACNPKLALDVYRETPDFASLLPCNAVVRDIGGGRVSVELAKPSALIKILGNENLTAMASDVDQMMIRALASI